MEGSMSIKNTYRAAKIIKDAFGLLEVSADTIAYELAKAGLLAPEPQIIRTVEELAALDPSTLLATRGLVAALPLEILWLLDSPPESVLSHDDLLPAVVVATGNQSRAARQALAEADREPETDDFHSSIGLWQLPPATWEEA